MVNGENKMVVYIIYNSLREEIKGVYKNENLALDNLTPGDNEIEVHEVIE